jgi:MATE family multidrug resistance protein
LTVLVIATRELIPLVSRAAAAPGAAEASAIAAMLLVLGASFFIADGVQTIAAGALRGLNDTRVPLLFAAIGFWIIGFSSSYALAFPAGFGVAGVWIGFSLGLAVFAGLLVWRFHLLTRRGYLPELAEPPSPAAAHE